MAEWLNAPVLKTGRPQGLAGSNPAPSASWILLVSVAGEVVVLGSSVGNLVDGKDHDLDNRELGEPVIRDLRRASSWTGPFAILSFLHGSRPGGCRR